MGSDPIPILIWRYKLLRAYSSFENDYRKSSLLSLEDSATKSAYMLVR